MPEPLSASWVLLTMGDRNEALRRAVESVLATDPAEVVVVVNGGDPTGVETALRGLDRTRLVPLDENLGIPAGRNLGCLATAGDIVCFLDDDAEVLTASLASETVAMFTADDRLGVVGFRLVDARTGRTARRHVPRPRADTAARSGEVTGFLGGACAIGRRCFDDVGGYDGDFFYAMEETDFAWRAVERGWRIWYRADLLVHHPPTEPTRHTDGVVRTARNRTAAVRKNLPLPLAVAHVALWLAITAVRSRSWRELRDTWVGTREGLRVPVEREPMRWRTAWRLTRLGRPPVI